MTDYPCKGCEKRQLGCHSTCEDYIKIHREADIARRARQLENKLAFIPYKSIKRRK